MPGSREEYFLKNKFTKLPKSDVGRGGIMKFTISYLHSIRPFDKLIDENRMSTNDKQDFFFHIHLSIFVYYCFKKVKKEVQRAVVSRLSKKLLKEGGKVNKGIK